jgi:Uncharacterized protein conserved in bacteria
MNVRFPWWDSFRATRWGFTVFHALVIHALRTRGIELKSWPLLDIVWIFAATLVVSLLLSMLLQKIDTRRFVS